MSIHHPLHLSEQALHVYIAFDYAPGIGAGIGIAQGPRDPRTGQVICHWTLNKSYATVWDSKDFKKQDIETPEACQIRAFREGLGRVRGFYKRTLRASSSRSGVLPRKTVINCEQRLVVDLVNRYVQREWKSSETDKVKTNNLNEPRQIRAVLKSIRQISRRGAEISIVKANPRDGAAVAAKRLARQKRVKLSGRD